MLPRMQGAWIAKALTQQALSRLPGGNSLNYFLQRHVARSLPHSDATFLHHCEFAGRYVAALREYTDKPVADARSLEFGAGGTALSPWRSARLACAIKP